MKIFITGGTGFLGYYIIQELVNQTDHDLLVLHRSSASLSHLDQFKSRIKFIEGDLENIHPVDAALASADMLIHAAANINFTNHKDDLYQTNVVFTGQLMDLALSNNVKKVVHISSTAALGKAFENKLLDEAMDWEASKYNSHYAETKYLGELEVWRAISEGLNAVIICPSQIIGTGDFSKGTPHLLQQVDKGISKYPIGSNGFVDVRDVAKMVRQSLENDLASGKYICSAENLSYKTILSILTKELSSKMPNSSVSKKQIQFLKMVESIPFLRPSKSINSQSLLVAQRSMQYSNAKSIKHFNFAYRNVAESLQEMALKYKQWKDDKSLSPYLL